METTETIHAKNLSDDWKNCISYTKEYPKTEHMRYVLYPTGECDLNGRKYIAIPEHVNIAYSTQLKKHYHILQ